MGLGFQPTLDVRLEVPGRLALDAGGVRGGAAAVGGGFPEHDRGQARSGEVGAGGGVLARGEGEGLGCGTGVGRAGETENGPTAFVRPSWQVLSGIGCLRVARFVGAEGV